MEKKKITPQKINKIEESQWYDSDYQPRPINWKKTGIISSVVISIITIIVLIWGFGVGGFAFISLRSYGKDAYITMNHDKNMSFCDNDNNFFYKYEHEKDEAGVPYPKPQEVCKKNVQFMKDNNLEQSKRIKIGLEFKHSNTNYGLAIKDLRWDLNHNNYITKTTRGNSDNDKILMEVTIIEISKINGHHKVVQLMRNNETRKDYCARGTNQDDDPKQCK